MHSSTITAMLLLIVGAAATSSFGVSSIAVEGQQQTMTATSTVYSYSGTLTETWLSVSCVSTVTSEVNVTLMKTEYVSAVTVEVVEVSATRTVANVTVMQTQTQLLQRCLDYKPVTVDTKTTSATLFVYRPAAARSGVGFAGLAVGVVVGVGLAVLLLGAAAFRARRRKRLCSG